MRNSYNLIIYIPAACVSDADAMACECLAEHEGMGVSFADSPRADIGGVEYRMAGLNCSVGLLNALIKVPTAIIGGLMTIDLPVDESMALHGAAHDESAV